MWFVLATKRTYCLWKGGHGAGEWGGGVAELSRCQDALVSDGLGGEWLGGEGAQSWDDIRPV